MPTTHATRVTSGFMLFSIGVIHNLMGLALGLGLFKGPTNALAGRQLIPEIVRDGVVGAFETDPWRMVLFWFLFFGLQTMILGWLVHRLERAGQPLPPVLAWQIAGLGLAGGLLIPASGFWLVLPVAWRIGRGRAAPALAIPATPSAAEGGVP